MDQGKTKLITMHKAILIDYKCQKKKEEDVLPSFRIALMQRYNDSKTALKSPEEDWLQPPEIIQTTQAST